MTTLAWIIVAIGAALLIGAVVAAAILGWRAYERRVLLRLVGRLEAIESSAVALRAAMTRIMELDAGDLAGFAEDPDNLDRRVLGEVASRATVLVEELDTMRLPSGLVPGAEALADAAFVIARESGRVREEHVGLEALDALEAVNLGEVQTYLARARHQVAVQCDVCGLDEPAVYGGGLYL